MSLSNKMEICKTCNFCTPQFTSPWFLPVKGRCHRYPPSYQESQGLEFVPVLFNDWCGEYKRNLTSFNIFGPVA